MSICLSLASSHTSTNTDSLKDLRLDAPSIQPTLHSLLPWFSASQEQSCWVVSSISLLWTVCHPSSAGICTLYLFFVCTSLLTQLQPEAPSLNTFLLVNLNFLASFPCALHRASTSIAGSRQRCFSALTSRRLSGAEEKQWLSHRSCPYYMISSLIHVFITARTPLLS